MAASVPNGSSVVLSFQGMDPATLLKSAWSADIDACDGFPLVKFRVVFLADPATGARPSLDTLVIPID